MQHTPNICRLPYYTLSRIESCNKYLLAGRKVETKLVYWGGGSADGIWAGARLLLVGGARLGRLRWGSSQPSTFGTLDAVRVPALERAKTHAIFLDRLVAAHAHIRKRRARCRLARW